MATGRVTNEKSSAGGQIERERETNMAQYESNFPVKETNFPGHITRTFCGLPRRHGMAGRQAGKEEGQGTGPASEQKAATAASSPQQRP